MNVEKSENCIDAVITWVDGNDKQWQDKINKHTEVKINFDQKSQMVRFNSVGEIDIAIKSIIKFAPFIRTIFIVTDNQTPQSFSSLEQQAMKKGMNLKIIDHKIIFKGYENNLPCFNSSSIESMIFKIPNLSEYFIFFNDDFFLMRNVKPTNFFINDNPIIRGKWEKFYEDRIVRNLYTSFCSLIGKSKKNTRLSYNKRLQEGAKLAGVSKYVRRSHIPVAMKKSTLSNYFEKNDDILRENIKHPFRNANQFNMPSLSMHLEIKQNTFHYQKDTQLTYFRSYKNIIFAKFKLNYFLRNKKKLFVTCQSLEMANHKIQDYIFKWAYKRLSE